MPKALDRRFEQTWSGRQENCQAAVAFIAVLVAASADPFGKFIEALQCRCIQRLIGQPVEEVGHAAAPVGGQMLLQRFSCKIAIFRIALFRPRGSDDAQLVVQQSVRIQCAERGQQHALRQIAGSAEQQQAIGSEDVGFILWHQFLRP